MIFEAKRSDDSLSFALPLRYRNVQSGRFRVGELRHAIGASDAALML